MILNTHTPDIERSDNFSETFFSIGNSALVFEILRSKLYSNPLQAVCREIISNCKDAHSEVNKSDLPIQITLPSTFEPTLKFKDWGPGISQDRAENIFVKFGASTKRNDNSQIGGFGIGVKSIFGISDSFTVETIVDHTKYQYQCYIDESKIGKMALLSSEISDEENGTEISIPIKAADFNAIRDNIEFICRHFKTFPIIKGGTITYKTPTFQLSGPGWGIDNLTSNYSGNRSIKLIIDGIEYPLDANSLKGSATKILSAINGNIYLYFNTGELSLSANREQVHLDEKTTAKIFAKLDLIITQFKEQVQEKIDACSNLFDANVYISSELPNIFYDTAFLGKLQWKGLETTDSGLYSDGNFLLHQFGRGGRGRKKETGKITKYNATYLYFRKNEKLFLNDTDILAADLLSKQVAKAFSDNIDLKLIQVISLNEKSKLTWKDLHKKYHFSEMGAGLVSDLSKDIKISPVKPTGEKLIIFKFNKNMQEFSQIAIAKMEEDTNKKILCKMERDHYDKSKRWVKLKDGQTLAIYTLSSLLDFKDQNKDLSIYAVFDTVPAAKIKEHFKKVQTIDEFIDEQLSNNQEIDFVPIKIAKEGLYYPDAFFIDNQSKIINKESLFLQNIALYQFYADLLANKSLLDLKEQLRGKITEAEIKKWQKEHPEKDLKAMKDKVDKTYPLLNYSYHYWDNKTPLLHYINLIDQDLIKNLPN